MTNYGEITKSWPRLAAAVNEACRVPEVDRQRGYDRPDLTRTEAQRRAVALANRPDAHRMGGWTVSQLRQALVAESEVAS